MKKFGKLNRYKLYMKLMKEDVVDCIATAPDDIIPSEPSDSSNDVHHSEEDVVNKPEPGVCNLDNQDLIAIHTKLMLQYKPAELIFDNKENNI